MNADTFLNNPKPIRSFPFANRDKEQARPIDLLTKFRADSAKNSMDLVLKSSDIFAANAKGLISGSSSERSTLNSFGLLASDLRAAANNLDAMGLMSTDIRTRLISAHTELVEAASKAVNKTNDSLDEISFSQNTSDKMRHFAEIAQPKMEEYSKFFEKKREDILDADQEADLTHNAYPKPMQGF